MARKKKATSMPRTAGSRGTQAVDEYLAGCDHPFKGTVVRLRKLLLSLESRIREEVKWNAPSFLIEEHFATFRLQPEPMCQLILHTGAKVRVRSKPFDISDPEHVLRWAARDRAIVDLTLPLATRGNFTPLAAILRQWIGQL